MLGSSPPCGDICDEVVSWLLSAELHRMGGTEPEDPVEREDKGRGARRYPNS